MKTSLFLAFALLTAVTPAIADKMVFYAVPTTRVQSWVGGDERIELTASDADDNFVQIDERDGKYFWTSREDRPLELNRSGIYWIFTHVASGNYVKVELFEGKMRYMEHVTITLTSFTYFGSEGTFDP